MENKKFYACPEAEVVEVMDQNVIATSGTGATGEDITPDW